MRFEREIFSDLSDESDFSDGSDGGILTGEQEEREIFGWLGIADF